MDAMNIYQRGRSGFMELRTLTQELRSACSVQRDGGEAIVVTDGKMGPVDDHQGIKTLLRLGSLPTVLLVPIGAMLRDYDCMAGAYCWEWNGKTFASKGPLLAVLLGQCEGHRLSA